MSSDEAWIRARFHDLIVPDLFARARPVTDPLWIGIGGQPGAGKTHGRDRALRLNDNTPVTAIIGDDLRAYHPDYRRLIRDDPLAMPAATAAASARWVELALDHAREHHYNVLVEGTFRRPETTLGTAQAFHQAGYRTHLVAIAVPPWESRLSSIERFQLDHEAGLTARWTAPAAHDAGVRGTPLTLDAAAASDHIDRISVVTREGRALFDKHRPEPLDEAARVLRDVHGTPPTPAELTEWDLRRRDVLIYLRRELPHAPETTAAARALAIDALHLHEHARTTPAPSTHREQRRMTPLTLGPGPNPDLPAPPRPQGPTL